MTPWTLTAGIDAGTSAIKVAVVRSRGGTDGQVLATNLQRIRRRNVRDVIQGAFDDACREAKVTPKEFDYVASTGDADAVTFATGHFYGMTTHARGALHLVPGATAVIDIGALHARAIRMDARGKVLDHRMTSQCASGSGQFLENIARYLGVPIEDVGSVSLQSNRAEDVSSICAVLAETDVINLVSRGMSTADILRGIHLSIAGRLARLVRSAGASGTVALSGGLSQDAGLVAALRELLAQEQTKGRVKASVLEVQTNPSGALAGAIGAALVAGYRVEQFRAQGRTIGAAAVGVPS